MTLFAKVGGATSGAGTSVGTALTLKYALETVSVWSGQTELRVIDEGSTFDIVPSGASGNQMNQILGAVPTGTKAAPKRIVGCNTSGEVNGARPRILGVGWGASQTSMFVMPGTLENVTFENIVWDGGSTSSGTGSYNLLNNSGNTGTGVGTNSTTSDFKMRVVNCRFTRSRHNALSCFGGPAGSPVAFGLELDRCELDNNGLATGSGMIIRGNVGSVIIRGCSFHHNTAIGATLNTAALDGPIVIEDSVFYANGSGALSITSGGSVCVQRTIIDGHTIGFVHALTTKTRIDQCVFSNNGMAVQDLAWDPAAPVSDSMSNCCFYGNTTADFEGSTGYITPPGDGHVYVDPGYVNPANGDYRIRANGPLGQLRTQSQIAAFGQKLMRPMIGSVPVELVRSRLRGM